MPTRNDQPDLMGEALGRFKLPDNGPRNKVIPLHPPDEPSYDIILEKLDKLNLSGMKDALEEQRGHSQTRYLSFEARLIQLLDSEIEEREKRRIELRKKKAGLPYKVGMGDLDYSIPRGLVKSLMVSLSSCGWILMHHNVVVTGPAGIGKTFIACALAGQACELGFTALYTRADQLLLTLKSSKIQCSADQLLAPLVKTSLLIIDNFGLEPLQKEQAINLLSLLDKRHSLSSVLLCSPLPASQWAGQICDPDIGKAIVDRLVPNSYLINLKGQSLRKGTANSAGISLDTDF